MKFQLLILLVMIGLGGCSPKQSIIEGRFISGGAKTLKDIEIQLTLINPHTKTSDQYITKLNSKGHFRIKVTQQGEHLFIFGIAKYPSDLWVYPQIADVLDPRVYDIMPSRILKMKDLYLNDAIKIIKPDAADQFDVADDITFKWAPISIADFYDLIITKQAAEKNEQLAVSSHHFKTNRITFADIRRLVLVEGLISFDQATESEGFNRKFHDLTAGEYAVRITAYKEVQSEKKAIRLCQSRAIKFSVIGDK